MYSLARIGYSWNCSRPRDEKRETHNERTVCLCTKSSLSGVAGAGGWFWRGSAQLDNRDGYGCDLCRSVSSSNPLGGGVSPAEISRVRGLFSPCAPPPAPVHCLWQRLRHILPGVVLETPRVQCGTWGSTHDYGT